MEIRILPLATFECSVCLSRETVRLTGYARRDGHRDVVEPNLVCPNGHGQMTVIQIDGAR